MRLTSLAEMRAAHTRLITETERAVTDALKDAEQEAKAQVRASPGFTPRTGTLQRGAKGRFFRTSTGRVLSFENLVHYAPFIDRGTTYIEPRWFMRRAVEAGAAVAHHSLITQLRLIASRL